MLFPPQLFLKIVSSFLVFPAQLFSGYSGPHSLAFATYLGTRTPAASAVARSLNQAIEAQQLGAASDRPPPASHAARFLPSRIAASHLRLRSRQSTRLRLSVRRTTRRSRYGARQNPTGATTARNHAIHRNVASRGGAAPNVRFQVLQVRHYSELRGRARISQLVKSAPRGIEATKSLRRPDLARPQSRRSR